MEELSGCGGSPEAAPSWVSTPSSHPLLWPKVSKGLIPSPGGRHYSPTRFSSNKTTQLFILDLYFNVVKTQHRLEAKKSCTLKVETFLSCSSRENIGIKISLLYPSSWIGVSVVHALTRNVRAVSLRSGSELKPIQGQFISHKPARKHKHGCLSVKETASEPSWWSSEVTPTSCYCESIFILAVVFTFVHLHERVSE